MLTIAVAVGGCVTISREPENLQHRKTEVVAYVESGDYDRELSAVSARAIAWLEQRVPQGDGKLAVVFDLDETLFRNWSYLRTVDFGYIHARWDAWVSEAQAPAIEPVRDVYRAARRLGVAVIFITGRRDSQRAATERNLRANELGDFAVLVCKPDGSKEKAASFKAATRRYLIGEGYKIVANLGDQESDLAGGYAERAFKLPNPFYISE